MLIESAFLDVLDGLFLDEDALDSHDVFGKSTGFVWADVISTTHGFTGLQVSDQVVLVFHFSDTVGQSNGDGKWESFRDCDDNDTYSDDESLNEFVEGIQSEQRAGKITRNVSFPQDVAQHTDKGGSSRDHTDVSDLFGEDCELLLERSLLGLFLEGDFEFAVLGVGSSGEDEDGAGTFVDFWAGNEEAVAFLVSSWYDFLDSIGFSSHGGLISNNIVAFNDDTVYRYDFTGFNQLDITDNKVIDWDVDNLTFSNDVDEFSLCDFVELFELLFLDVVISRGDSNDDYNGNQYWGALHPAVFQALSGNTENKRYNCSDTQDSEHVVFEVFNNLR